MTETKKLSAQMYKRDNIMENNKISSDAKKAEAIKSKMPDDVRMATEAMQRTMKVRRTHIFFLKEYKYQRIF